MGLGLLFSHVRIAARERTREDENNGLFHGILHHRDMCTSVSSLCYVQCVFKSGHVLFGEAAPGPAPSKEHPRMLEIDPTSRLIEEFKYLIATILRE